MRKLIFNLTLGGMGIIVFNKILNDTLSSMNISFLKTLGIDPNKIVNILGADMVSEAKNFIARIPNLIKSNADLQMISFLVIIMCLIEIFLRISARSKY